MRSARQIARYIIWRCGQKGYSVSNLKLQKILYFVQAEFLVNAGYPCFYENIEAWDFGPVVPEVYFEYRMYGSSNITMIGNSQIVQLISNAERSLLDGIIDQCAPYSASALVDITHHQTPWIDAYNKAGYNNVISNKDILEYFEPEPLEEDN